MRHIALFLLLFIGCVSLSYAEGDKDKAIATSTKKCVADLLKGCCDREKRSSEAITQLMDKVSDASKSNDPAAMKKTLDDTKKALADLKSDHDKSAELMKKIHERMQALKGQIKAVKKEHDQASGLVEDEDMDDVIWAY